MECTRFNGVALAEPEVTTIRLEVHTDRSEYVEQGDLVRLLGEHKASSVAGLTREDACLCQFSQQLREVRHRDVSLLR